jgi:hypothetical protein
MGYDKRLKRNIRSLSVCLPFYLIVILSVVIAGCQQLLITFSILSPSLTSTIYMYISSYSLAAFLFSFCLLRSEVYQAVLEKLLRPNRRTGKQCSTFYSVLFCSTLFYSVLCVHLTEQMHWYCTRCDSFFFIVSYSTLFYYTLLYWHFTLYTSCCIIVFYFILSSLLLSSNYPRPPSSTSSPS